MKIMLNGEQRETLENLSVLGLLEELGMSADAVVVEHNGAIIDRERYNKIRLGPDDVVELVRIVGGG